MSTVAETTTAEPARSGSTARRSAGPSTRRASSGAGAPSAASGSPRLAEDVDAAFEEALGRPGGAVGRGPNRYYVEIHPQALRGFVDIATHPWITAATEAVLGAGLDLITEVGFDVPGHGAMNQPWHRDFPMPEETRARAPPHVAALQHHRRRHRGGHGARSRWRRAPSGTTARSSHHGMFPPKSFYPRYEERAVRRFPQMGDISARTALTLHRGTRHASLKRRPVLVIGMDGPDGTNFERHDMAVTRDYYAALPESVRRHLACPVVDELAPISQKHTIEGLVMGEA